MFAALGTVQYIIVEVLAAFGIRIRGGQRNDDAARVGPGFDGEVEKGQDRREHESHPASIGGHDRLYQLGGGRV